MADEKTEGEAKEPEKKGSSLMKYVIIGMLALLLISTAVLGTLYMTGGDEEVAEGTDATGAEGEAAAAPEEEKKPMQYMSLAPAFVVNFSGDSQGRFMQISLEVGARDPAVLEHVKEQMPAIRNNLVLLFGSQSPEVLGTREGKEKLREDLLAEVSAVLEAETGSSGVDGIYFTSFVMQ